MTGADIVTELIKIRHQRGMRQRDVAEKAGVCPSTIGHLEARKRAPRLSAIVRRWRDRDGGCEMTCPHIEPALIAYCDQRIAAVDEFITGMVAHWREAVAAGEITDDAVGISRMSMTLDRRLTTEGAMSECTGGGDSKCRVHHRLSPKLWP